MSFDKDSLFKVIHNIIDVPTSLCIIIRDFVFEQKFNVINSVTLTDKYKLLYDKAILFNFPYITIKNIGKDTEIQLNIYDYIPQKNVS